VSQEIVGDVFRSRFRRKEIELVSMSFHVSRPLMTYVINNMTYVILIYLSPQLVKGESQLILPCEIAVKSAIPAIKAAMAKELVETYQLNQNQVAEILGISQSAVSKYTRQVRGYVLKIDNIEELQPLINRTVNLLVNEDPKRAEFLKLFCQMCTMIRKKGLMCQFCQKADPKIEKEQCGFCVDYSPL